MLKRLEFVKIEQEYKTEAQKQLSRGNENYTVKMQCERGDIEGVKLIVSGYNVLSDIIGSVVSSIQCISSVIGRSNVLKAKEIEEMKLEHKERMLRDERPREDDIVDIDGIEHVVLRRKFKNGKVTYVLKDKNMNIVEKDM